MSTPEALASAFVPTKIGDVRLSVVRVDDAEHVALVQGEAMGVEHLPTYLHCECLVGDVLGSLRCDCRGRLDRALEWLGTSRRGAILYLRPKPQSLVVASLFRRYAADVEGTCREVPTADCEVASAVLRALGVRSAIFIDP